MEWIKVSAKTVEDAVMEAAIMLGTSTDGMEYNVIEKGSSGFLFGIGAKKAVIEARKKKSDEELMREVFGEEKEKQKKERREKAPKQEKQEKQEKAAHTQKPARPENKPENKPAKKENNKEAGKETASARKEAAPEKKGKEPARKGNAEEAVKKAAPAEPKKEKHPAKKENREKGKDPEKEVRSRQKAEAKSEAKADAKAVSKPETKAETRPEAHAAEEKTENREPRVPADPAVAKARAEGFLNQLFASIGMKVDVQAKFEEDTLSVDISGDDMGILIGKHGQTLDSLQYLTSLVVNKGNAAYVRVKLDTEDYRSRRKETLENLARNIAGKVRRSGHPVFLEPMNPYERRIIHSALQNDEYVTTHSEGEEPSRKVVITLRKGVEASERRERPERSRGRNRYGRGERGERSDRSGRYGSRADRYSRSRFEESEEDSAEGAAKPSRADLIAAGLIAAAGTEDILTINETDSFLRKESEQILESVEKKISRDLAADRDYEETGESIEDIINSLDIHSPTGVVEKKKEDSSVDNVVKEISEELAAAKKSAEEEAGSVSEVMEEIRKKYDLNQSEQ